MPFDPDAPDAFGARKEAVAASKDDTPAPRPPSRAEELDLDDWTEDELLDLRSEVEARLPVKSLDDTNLTKELVFQVVALQKLQRDVMREQGVPANQRAQVANSLSAALSNLVKVQQDVYTSERFKQFERLVIEFINSAPDSVTKDAWYKRWEEIVRGVEGG